jgi:hypothetical protein
MVRVRHTQRGSLDKVTSIVLTTVTSSGFDLSLMISTFKGAGGGIIILHEVAAWMDIVIGGSAQRSAGITAG